MIRWNTVTTLTSSPANRETLYIGITSDLETRIREHRSGTYGGFTTKYKVHRLVYYEQFT
jgi:putative endonuclease